MSIDVVICTYNNAGPLHSTLEALSRQRGAAAVDWSVTVIANACTDDTVPVVQGWMATRAIPRLRVVEEPRPGLVQARRRGVEETSGDWIAFLDDDCIVADSWIAAAASFAPQYPRCGAFGGRVIPEWQGAPPRYASRYMYAFAEQNFGDQPTTVGWLVGAGLILNRQALAESRWTGRQYMPDRIGSQLLSGGDMEMVLRISGAGYQLWYEPLCVLRHILPLRRSELSYMTRLNFGLGVSQMACNLMQSKHGWRKWLASSVKETVRSHLKIGLEAVRIAKGTREPADVKMAASFAGGLTVGLWRLAAMPPEDRRAMLGAAVRSPQA